MTARPLSLAFAALSLLGTRSAAAQCEREEAALQRCRESDPHGLENCQDRCVLRMRACMAPVVSAARSLLRRVRSGTIGPNAAERRQEALSSRASSCEESRDECNSQCEETEGDRCSRQEASRSQCQERVEAERRAANEAEARRAAAEHAQLRQRRRDELVASVDAVRVDAPDSDLLALLQQVDTAAIGDEALRATLRDRLLGRLISARLADARRQRERGDLDGSEGALDVAATHLSRVSLTSPRRAEADNEVSHERSELTAARDRARAAAMQRLLGAARSTEERGEWRAARSLYSQLLTDRGVGQGARDGITRIDEHRRSPAVASVLSMFLPGTGQMYAGRPGSGIGFLLGTAALFTGGALLYREAEERHAEYRMAREPAAAGDRYDETRQFWIGSLVAFGVGGALWLWNVLDARGSAVTWNEERVGSND